MNTFTLLVAGQRMELADVGSQLNSEFRQLYASYFASVPLSVQSFHNAAADFFRSVAKGNADHQAYFNNFTIPWINLMAGGQLKLAEELWEFAILPVVSFEEQSGTIVHKGSPFYWFGVTALRRGDVDRGYALMHQALDEDMRGKPTGSALPFTPAASFATLDDQRPDQYFREWPIKQAEYLEKHLATYAAMRSAAFGIADVREKFLRHPPDNDTLFDLNYVIARLRQISSIPAYALRSSFASQLQLAILFELARIIEVVIKHKSGSTGLFKDQAFAFAQRIGSCVTQIELGELNGSFNTSFDKTLDDLLDGRYSTSGRRVLVESEIDIAVAYGVRNRRGHSTSSSAVVAGRFPDLERRMMHLLFRVVEVMY